MFNAIDISLGDWAAFLNDSIRLTMFDELAVVDCTIYNIHSCYRHQIVMKTLSAIFIFLPRLCVSRRTFFSSLPHHHQ